MDDNICVRKLLEFVFIQELRITPEMTVSNSSFPACLHTNDLPRKMNHILMVRRVVMSLKWAFQFENCIREMIESHHSYITCIVCSCLKEHYSHQNIFDSFLCVCSCAKYFSEETLRRTGVDLRELNFDIIMEIYNTTLKKIFLRRGGFMRLIEFIHQHKYLAWNLDEVSFSTLDDPIAYLDEDMADKLEKELARERATSKSHNLEIAGYSMAMTQNILSSTSVKLPPLPTEEDLNKRANTSVLRDKTNITEGKNTHEEDLKLKPLKEVWQKYSSLNLDSKMYKNPQQIEDLTRYGHVFQAVPRYISLKASDLANSDNCILQKADEIIKHLKNTIESLIKVLEKPDKEFLF